MDEPLVSRYWCHMCSRMVNPVMEVEIKCPLCDSGFVEEMDGRGESNASNDVGSEQDMSLWAPILLGMLGGGLRRRRFHQGEEDDEDSSDRDRELEGGVLQRRRRSSALLQLLQALREGSRTESDGTDGERERVIVMNPFSQTIILQGSLDQNQNQTPSTNHGSSIGVSLGDYFLGPGLELLLQHLAENDPNRYGTPPAHKEAVDAMPTVEIDTEMSCSVCLEDFEVGAEAKEMPCKHKFHSDCILPWLELHSSCPVCRHQMPADESKVPNAGSSGSRPEAGTGGGGEGGDNGQRRLWIPVPWPFSFNGMFTLSGSQGSGGGDQTSNSGSNPSNEN